MARTPLRTGPLGALSPFPAREAQAGSVEAVAVATALADANALGAIDARPPVLARTLAGACLARAMAPAIIGARPAAAICSVTPSSAETMAVYTSASTRATAWTELHIACGACPAVVASADFVIPARTVPGAATRTR